MTDPTERILAWIDSVPPKLQSDLLFFVSMMLPGCEEPVDAAKDFRERVLTLATRRAQLMGMALGLIVLIDRFFESLATTSDEVKDAMEFNERIAKEAESDPDAPEGMAKTIRDIAARLPFRGKQWAKEVASWSALKSEWLSIERIDEWFSEAMTIDLA